VDARCADQKQAEQIHDSGTQLLQQEEADAQVRAAALRQGRNQQTAGAGSRSTGVSSDDCIHHIECCAEVHSCVNAH
jgi:hypothetical protein